MSVLLDTNIILRLAQPHHELHDIARDAAQRLNRQNVSLCIVPQIIYEYWVVVTRPVENNGFGMTTKDAESAVQALIKDLPLFGDERSVFENWWTLVSKYEFKGKTAHDARLVAAMLKYPIQEPRRHLVEFHWCLRLLRVGTVIGECQKRRVPEKLEPSNKSDHGMTNEGS